MPKRFLIGLTLAFVLLTLFGCKQIKKPIDNNPANKQGQVCPTIQKGCLKQQGGQNDDHQSNRAPKPAGCTLLGCERTFFPGTILSYESDRTEPHQPVNYVFVFDRSKSFLGNIVSHDHAVDNGDKSSADRLGCSAQAIHDRAELASILLKLAVLYQRELSATGKIYTVWVGGNTGAPQYPYLHVTPAPPRMEDMREKLQGSGQKAPGFESLVEVFRWIGDMGKKHASSGNWFVFLFTDGWMSEVSREVNIAQKLDNSLKQLRNSPASNSVRIYPFVFVDCVPPGEIVKGENGERKWKEEKWSNTIDFWLKWNESKNLPGGRVFFVGLPQREWKRKFEEFNKSKPAADKTHTLSWREAFRAVINDGNGAFPGVKVEIPHRPDIGQDTSYSRIFVKRGYRSDLYVLTNLDEAAEEAGNAFIHRNPEATTGADEVKITSTGNNGQWYAHYAQPQEFYSVCKPPYWQWKWNSNDGSKIEDNLWVFLLREEDERINWENAAKKEMGRSPEYIWKVEEKSDGNVVPLPVEKIAWDPAKSLVVRLPRELRPYRYCDWQLFYEGKNVHKTLKKGLPVELNDDGLRFTIPMSWPELRNSLPCGKGNIFIRLVAGEDTFYTSSLPIERACSETIDLKEVSIENSGKTSLTVKLANAINPEKIPERAIYRVTMGINFKENSLSTDSNPDSNKKGEKDNPEDNEVTLSVEGHHLGCSATVALGSDRGKDFEAQPNGRGRLEISYSGPVTVGEFLWDLHDEKCKQYVDGISVEIEWENSALQYNARGNWKCDHDDEGEITRCRYEER